MEAHDMSNCNCNSLSCGRPNACNPCGCNSWTACGCSGDSTPACNPCVPWGQSGSNCTCNRCNHSNWGCMNSCSSTCSVCGNNPCTCGSCGQWGSCYGSTSGYLVPRYVSIGRTFQRRITQTLCINDIPDCAESPLTLVCVTVSGQATWEQISECRQQLLLVTVPVAVQVRDCSGRCRTGHTTVTLTIPLCGCSAQDLWRGQLYVAPCIRLAAPVTENEDGCFDATLEVQADVYLVRMVAINS